MLKIYWMRFLEENTLEKKILRTLNNSTKDNQNESQI